MDKMLEWALYHQGNGFKVYPLAPGTSKPLAGSHGFKDATTDKKQALAWWRDTPNANIALGLDQTGVLVLDIDRHARTGADGFKTLRQLASKDRAGQIPETYAEDTPNGGLHLFFTYPPEMQLTQHTNLFSDGDEQTGIDMNAQGVPIAPSQCRSGRYQQRSRLQLSELARAPAWLLAELARESQSQTRLSGEMGMNLQQGMKTWAGRFLDEMVNGTSPGSRNAWLTRMAGKLFSTGADPETIYNMLLVANTEFITQPLPKHEVTTVFRSALRMQGRKYANDKAAATRRSKA